MLRRAFLTKKVTAKTSSQTPTHSIMLRRAFSTSLKYSQRFMGQPSVCTGGGEQQQVERKPVRHQDAARSFPGTSRARGRAEQGGGGGDGGGSCRRTCSR